MKKLLLTSIILLLSSFIFLLYAQSIERSVISSFGFSYSGATFQNDCTVGETITATGANGAIKITQGFQQPAFQTSTCFGDFDNNGVVNTADLLLLMSGFGCTLACGVYDVNSDGVVNTTDLLLFMSAFGSVCP